MLGVDPEIGISAVRLWAAAASGALLAVCCVLAFMLPRTAMGAAARVGLVILGAAVGGAMVWAFVPAGNGGAERRALALRAQQLTAQSLAPGSPLACLNGLVGASIATACEKEIFATPESVAATISYTAARLTLLSEVSAYVARGDAGLDDVLAPLRRALAADRYGFVAYVLAIREACTSDNCRPLALLGDAGRVRANLADAALDRYLDHYRPLWAKLPDGGAVAEAAQARPDVASRVPRSHMVDIDFPSAASIPAVSIMNPEPKGPVLPGAAAAAAANPNPPSVASSPSRRARRQAANPAPAAAPAAVPNPPAPVEPIWPEPMPRSPAASAGTARGQ